MPRTFRASPQLKQRAAGLRHEPTAAEDHLWQQIRLKRIGGARFRRQHAIGPYIVDFCAPDLKLAIEVDGGQHEQQAKRDAERTRFLEAQGYRVIRFWNAEVMKDVDAVVRMIMAALEE